MTIPRQMSTPTKLLRAPLFVWLFISGPPIFECAAKAQYSTTAHRVETTRVNAILDTAWAERRSTANVTSESEPGIEATHPVVQLPPRFIDEMRIEVERSIQEVEARWEHLQADEVGLLRQRLGWAELREAMRLEPMDPRPLQAASARLYGTWEGLELPELLVLRENLPKLIDRLVIAQDPDLPRTYAKHLNVLLAMTTTFQNEEAIADSTGLFERTWSDSTTGAPNVSFNESLAWIDASGLHPEIVETFRNRQSYPHLYIGVDENLALRKLEEFRQDVDEWQYRELRIVGVPVSGKTHTHGRVVADVVRGSEDLRVSLRFDGVADSPYNTARQGAFRIYSRGRTELEAQTEIYFDGTGLRTLPPVAECRTQSVLVGASIDRTRLFSASCGGVLDQLLGQLAIKQAAKKREQAELESERIAERELIERLTVESEKVTAAANAEFDRSLRLPMIRLGLWSDFNLQGIGKFLGTTLRRESSGNWGADSPPDLAGVDGALVLCGHQSALGSYLRPLIGGTEWQDRDFSNLQSEIIGDRSYEMRMGLHESWSLVFDWWRPWSATVDNEVVTFVLKAQRLRIGDVETDEPFEIKAHYRIRSTRLGPEFVRQGDVEVRWPEAETLGAPQTDREERHSFLVRKFNGFFLETFYMDGLAAPAGGGWDSVSGLRVMDVRVDDGWLVFILRKFEDAPRAALLD